MLDSVSPQIVVALTTALLTAVVTLASVFVANIGQRKMEEAKFKRSKQAEHVVFKREKLEDLYLLFSKWDADMAALGYIFFPVMRGEAREEEALLSASKNQLSEKDYLQRILMLVDLYFPDFKGDFDEVLDARERVWPYFSESFPPGIAVEDFILAQENFRMVGKNFKQKLAGLAHALAYPESAST